MSINQATYKQHLKLVNELASLLNQSQLLPGASTINPLAFWNLASPQPSLEYPNTRIGQLISDAGWNTSLLKEKEIDLVIELLYIELGMSDSKIEAEETLLKQKIYFFQTVPPDLCYSLIPHWWTITSKYQKDNIQTGIIYEALEAFRDRYPQTNIHEILGYGDTLINDPDTLKDHTLLETARFYTLKHQISLINPASIEHLKTVHYRS